MKRVASIEEKLFMENNKAIEFKEISPSEYITTFEGKNYNFTVLSQFDNQVELLVNGRLFEFKIDDLGDELISKLGLKNKQLSNDISLKSPMPGLIKEIFINKGDELKKGDAILILEAMKMENTLKCPKDGLIVQEIKISKGQSVEKNVCLVKF